MKGRRTRTKCCQLSSWRLLLLASSWHLISQVRQSSSVRLVAGKGVKITKFHLKTKTIFPAQAELLLECATCLYFVLLFFFCVYIFWHVLSVLQHNGILCARHTNSESIYENAFCWQQAKSMPGPTNSSRSRNGNRNRNGGGAAIKAGR